MKLDPYLVWYREIYLKSIKDLNLKPEAVKHKRKHRYNVLCVLKRTTDLVIVVLGYMVAYTKVSTLCIKYLNWSPPPLLYLPPPSHSWNTFNRSHFSIYILMYKVCTIFTLLHLFSTFSPSHWHLPFPWEGLPQGKTCSAIQFSDFVKEKNIV
jgi:hypothetical protein